MDIRQAEWSEKRRSHTDSHCRTLYHCGAYSWKAAEGMAGNCRDSLFLQLDIVFMISSRISSSSPSNVKPVAGTNALSHLAASTIPKQKRGVDRIFPRKIHPWTFLRVQGIEPSNKTAERALRPAVIYRKLSFGTQSGTWSKYQVSSIMRKGSGRC